MTKDEIIKLAHKSGLHLATDVNWMPIIGIDYAERFAELVAKHTLMNIDPSKFMSHQESIKAAREAERERLASLIEKMPFGDTAASFAQWIRDQA